MTDQMAGQQLLDFAHTHARTTDPDTSHKAAREAHAFAGSQADRIAAALVTFGPMGATAIGETLGLTNVQVARRLPELLAAGRAQPTEQTATTQGGADERVWVAT